MTCEHPGCKCLAGGVQRGGHHYCSEECAAQGAQVASGGCRCGHPACG